MLQFEHRHPVVGADQPRVGRDRAGELEAGVLRRDVDRVSRDEDADHPPVTGGKIATSRAPASGASDATNAWSTAARSRVRSANASA